MSTHRYIDVICCAVLVLTLLITVLFMNGEAFGLQMIVDEDAEDYEGSVWFTPNDQNGTWETASATQIALRGDDAAVSGGGAYAYDGNVMITSAGKYVVSGTLNNGRIIVDTNNAAKVWILLNGAKISCADAACIDIEQADKVFLTLAEGTDNSLTTSGFSDESSAAGMDGALFSRDDLTINGSGSLCVSAAVEHGITVNDELVITGGTITVTAERDALHVNDGLRMKKAVLSLSGGDDGISLTGLGSDLYVESGTVELTAVDNGITAENSITLVDGKFTVEAGNDGITAAGNIEISGGYINVTAGDDGIQSDTAVLISGGTVLIPSCYEGIEAVIIDISGGDITVYPEDDGLNANGAADLYGGFGGGGMPNGDMLQPQDNMEPPEGLEFPQSTDIPLPPAGSEMPQGQEDMEPFSEAEQSVVPGQQEIPGDEAAADSEATSVSSTDAGSTDETWIRISGGSITVINDSARDSDGLDSNGDIIITGGTVRVSLTNSGSNSALDFGSENGGVMEISGGEVVACGSYSMAEGFGSASTQCSILYNIKRGAAAGTKVSLEDSEGNILLSYDVPCSFSSVAISCPDMHLGETYTVVVGDSAEEITLDEITASFGDAESENFSGPMNWGGMKFRP